MESNALNPAQSGAVRLGDTEQIMWRNNSNNADIGIDVNNDIFNIINAVTINAAKALGLNAGEIAEGKKADMLILDLDSEPNEELAIHLILHRYNISKVYINGKLEKED
mgnify:CR=1 FL=1